MLQSSEIQGSANKHYNNTWDLVSGSTLQEALVGACIPGSEGLPDTRSPRTVQAR